MLTAVTYRVKFDGVNINRRVQTRAGTLAVADHGDGSAVVLWPSLFSDHRLYRHVDDLLGEEWRTICIDGPGFGRSSPPAGDVQPDRYAGAVVDLLDALGIETAVIGGCSWGGQVAAHAGVQAPERITAVLMMNTALGPSQGGSRFLVRGTRALGSTTLWGKGVARSMIARCTVRDHPERVADFVAAFSSFDAGAAATTVRTVLARSPGLAAVLPRLHVPTTILMGAEDTLIPIGAALPLAGLVPDARVEIVPNCGHLAPLDAPEVVVAALNSFRRQG